MRIRMILLFILTFLLSRNCTAAGAAGTPKKKKAVAPASSSVPDFVLHLTSNYCDTALPYIYKDDGSNPSLKLWARPSGHTSKYETVYNAIDSSAAMKQEAYAPNSGSPPMASQVDEAFAFPSGLSSSRQLVITDPGDSILGQSGLELGPDGFDAARLLVRTLQPSLVGNACNPNANAHSSTNGIISPDQLGTGFVSFSKAAYYLIDIVRWQTVSSNGQSTNQVASDHWYLFDFSDAKSSHRKAPFTFRPFVTSDLRIFGDAKHPAKTNVVFLAIHLAPQGSPTETDPKGDQSPNQQKWFDTVDISYKLHADKVVPANIADLESLVNLIIGASGQTSTAKDTKAVLPPPTFQGRYGAGLIKNLRDLPAKVTSSMTATFNGPPDRPKASAYCAAVKKNLLPSSGTQDVTVCPDSSKSVAATTTDAGSSASRPVAVSYYHPAALASYFPESQSQVHLLSTTYSLTPASARTNSSSAPLDFSGTSPSPSSQQTNPPPANCDSATSIDPTSKMALQKPCTLTQTIKDEGLYHWDVSIGIPTGYKETVFNNSTLMPKSVTRTDAYAMLDIAPWGEDFIEPPLFGIPHLMTGLPISGKVFNKPFIGGLGEDVGLTKILPFSARVFAGVVYNKEFRGAAQDPHRVWKVEYGIELSMSSAISKLKGNSKAKTNSSTTGTTN